MPVNYDSAAYPEFQHTPGEYRSTTAARSLADGYVPAYAGRPTNPPSPTRVSTYPRPDPNAGHTMSPKRTYDPNASAISGSVPAAYERQQIESRAQLERAAIESRQLDNLRSAYPNYTGTAVAVVEKERNPSLEKERGRETRDYKAAVTVSPYRRRSPQKASRSISPPKERVEGIPAPVRAYDEAKHIMPEPKAELALDLTAWRMRLNQVGREELKQLITSHYDRNFSGSIDFCDFLALWFSQQMFQIRRSNTVAGENGKESEPFEVQAKHIYRIREIFNEYEESYLSGVRYGLVSAMVKDLMYDGDHEVQHYYGLSTDDMVSLVEELAMHRQIRSQQKEPRYDFAYVLQLLFKYITDNEEIALYYDEGCKVFQTLRTKEYGEQPIYQNSTISTKLLIKVLTAHNNKRSSASELSVDPRTALDDRGYEESLILPTN